jgi:exosortase family protein XrtF
MNWGFFNQNRKAIQFLLIFIGLYLALKMIYGFYIQYYYPTSDPFTRLVASHVVWVLSFFDPTITAYPSQFNGHIALANDRENMIYISEGYNGLNVLIVYLSFLFAFAGPRKPLFQFIIIGLAGIYLLNIGRLCLLYGVRSYLPDQALFFQKYLLAVIIYGFVFVMWYFWIRKTRKV